MELSHAALLGFRTRYEALFNAAFNLVTPQIEKVAVKVESGRVEQVVHRWLRGIPGMREFLDTRTINNLSTDGLTVKNKLWEDTVGIPRVDLERDLYKIYDPMISRVGQTAALHRDSLGFEMLSDMVTAPSGFKAYDGVNFYGTHNVDRSVAFTNLSDKKLTEVSLSTAITELKKRRDTAGNVLAATASKPLLIIPPSLIFTAEKLANMSYIVSTQPGTGASSATSQAGASENVLKGSFDFIQSPYLKTDTQWHLTLVDPYLKPLIWQIEQDLEFLNFEKFLAQWAMNDQFVFGVRALYNVAPGLPEMCYGSTGTV